MWRVPTELEDAVLAAARAVVGDDALAPGVLARAVVDRSRRYTSTRDQLAAPRDARADLAARAAFFTIADAMKIGVPLAELAGRDALPARAPLRVVDLGAGCGAMTLGLLAALPASVVLDVVAIDHDADALRIAADAVRRFAGARATIATRTGELARVELPGADLIVLGSVLNELPPPAREPLVTRALAALADDGALIAIEPALRDTARALHALRDAVIARGAAHVFAPCTRTAAPCPMLADARDWCHEDRPLQLAPRADAVARTTHLRDAGMRFSYLVLRKTALPLVAHTVALRVVSAPLRAKGKLEVFACGEDGRLKLRLLDRARSPSNRELSRARRGDVVLVDRTAPPPGGAAGRALVPAVDDAGAGAEITTDTRVERIAPGEPTT
jgi:ribosomal protein RSM22 (predicted rRNA methylase)